MVRTGLRVLGLSLVALAVLFVSAAPARAANVSCQVTSGGGANPAGPEGNVLEVLDTSESVTHIYRKGDEIVVSNNADREPAACARATPTVFNIDKIVYTTSSGVPFINYLGDGPLAPGASPEQGAAEIEILIRESYKRKVVNVAGTAAGESIQVGQLDSGTVGVNLDAGADGAYQDGDDIEIDVPPRDEIYLRVVAKGGDDTLSALGGPNFTNHLNSAERLVMTGGPGDDVLDGGPFNDTLRGEDGDDKLLGGRGRDKLLIGPGRDYADGGKGDDDIENQGGFGGIEDLVPDRIFGGAGDDSISVGQQLRGDRVDCGAGRHDDVFKDAGDISLNCEQTDLR
jgi:Ca2+-binding RTX toxin-like protein